MKTDTCGHCGKEITLVKWGKKFYRWVSQLPSQGRGHDVTWKCQPDETQPVRAHFPRVLP